MKGIATIYLIFSLKNMVIPTLELAWMYRKEEGSI
ncbi:hypothetical protein N783_00640 [Pontibacillus marinus BH030004 = DSM 16465]|uniref:Uncharacterized protein n=1 Tax=Pontibacillus marinus BH030004 = DSM 16465 TaxID=1385511 RepID=A0A0A5GF93_9BACI|nr:hypothetical protein N783_00640 [Pontibacillus marinus BH030004 = DSM 16465]